MDTAFDEEQAALARPVNHALRATRIVPLAVAIDHEFYRLHEAEAADLPDPSVFAL